jgi:hypothetical protein
MDILNNFGEEIKYKSLFEFELFASGLGAICFANSALKCYLNLRIYYDKDQKVAKLNEKEGGNNFILENFWLWFMVDLFTLEFPIILYLTVLNSTTGCYSVCLTVIAILFLLISKYKIHFKNDQSVLFVNLSSVDSEIIKLSINLFRAIVFISTSIAILACDYSIDIFSRDLAKTANFGIGFMDIGVGYFIICHSMRLIRNDSINENAPAEESSFRK